MVVMFEHMNQFRKTKGRVYRMNMILGIKWKMEVKQKQKTGFEEQENIFALIKIYGNKIPENPYPKFRGSSGTQISPKN